MKDKIESGERIEIRRIVESIKQHKKGGSEVYSTILEWDITEVLKKRLKSFARDANPEETFASQSLLPSCIAHVKLLLTSGLEESGIDFDLSPYLAQAEESLNPPAKQISESLGGRAILKAQGIDIPPPQTHHLESGVIVLVTHIGYADSIDGLFLTPQTESFGVNLEAIDAGASTDTDIDYPYEIHSGGMCFVLDDDGTIFVSTKQTSQGTSDDVLGAMISLANRIFLLE